MLAVGQSVGPTVCLGALLALELDRELSASGLDSPVRSLLAGGLLLLLAVEPLEVVLQRILELSQLLARCVLVPHLSP